MTSETEASDLPSEVPPPNYKELGDNCYKKKDYKGAIANYSEAIAVDPQNALLYLNRAAASIMNLSYAEAIQDCNTTIRYNIDQITNAKAYFRLVSCYKGVGKLDEAIESASKGLECDNTNNNMTKELHYMNNVKSTLPVIIGAVNDNQVTRNILLQLESYIKDLGTNFRELNMLKVKCLIYYKKFHDAYTVTNAIMRTAASSDIELIDIRAQCLYKMGDLDNAKTHLQSALRLDPDNKNIRNFYKKIKEIEEKKEAGASAFKSSNYTDAISLWSECIDLDPLNDSYNAKLYNNRASALSKVKKYQEAIADLDKAIGIDDSYTKAYLKRADCYYSLGGVDKINLCIKDYEKAAELSSEEEASDIKKKIKQAKVALKRAGRKDLYAILGVGPKADDEEIRKAFKKSALKFHPDKQTGKSDEEKAENENKFKAVNEAYEILSDATKRARYDQGVEIEDIDNPHAGCGGRSSGHDDDGMGGIDPSILMQMFMQQQMGGGGGFGGGFPGGRGRGRHSHF